MNKQNLTRQMEGISGGAGHRYDDMAMMGSPRGRFDVKLALEKLEVYLTLPLIPAKLYSIEADEYLDDFYAQKLISAEECAGKI